MASAANWGGIPFARVRAIISYLFPDAERTKIRVDRPTDPVSHKNGDSDCVNEIRDGTDISGKKIKATDTVRPELARQERSIHAAMNPEDCTAIPSPRL